MPASVDAGKIELRRRPSERDRRRSRCSAMGSPRFSEGQGDRDAWENRSTGHDDATHLRQCRTSAGARQRLRACRKRRRVTSRQALRMRVGEPVALFTGAGGEYATTIAQHRSPRRHLRIGRHDPVERETPWPVTLVQAIIAADMMDLVVRKAVELGVAAIVPLQAARSQTRRPTSVPRRRLAHWRQIAIAACEQCGRNRMPEVDAGRRHSRNGSKRCMARVMPSRCWMRTATRSLAGIAGSTAPRTIAIGSGRRLHARGAAHSPRERGASAGSPRSTRAARGNRGVGGAGD